MLVPWPARTVTRLPATETVTRPCSTNTPNTSLLGPAKKRVPRTAISPNVLRICTLEGVLRAGRSNSIPPESEIDLAARIDEIAVDGEPRPLAQLERGVAAETHGQPRVRPGADLVAHEQRRRSVKLASHRVLLGKGLPLEVLDRADLCGGLPGKDGRA